MCVCVCARVYIYVCVCVRGEATDFVFTLPYLFAIHRKFIFQHYSNKIMNPRSLSCPSYNYITKILLPPPRYKSGASVV